MKLNKKILMESIIVSFVMMFVYYGWKTARGMFLTQNYMSGILDNYNSTDYLQQASSFGTVYENKWMMMLTGIGGFLLILIAYYLIRIALKVKKRK